MHLYFNPRCSKSRGARELLERAGHRPEIVDYQARPLTPAALERLLDALDAPPEALVRTEDAGFARFDDGAPLDRERVVTLLTAAPELMQRPVLVVDDTAVIARPPERIFELLPDHPTEDRHDS